MTPADLEQLPDRELDALVSALMFGIEARVPKRECHTGAIHHEETVIRGDLPFHPTSWDGFGVVVERMRELGFHVDVANFRLPDWGVKFFKGAAVMRAFHDGLPRAAAMAAVLAVRAAS